MVKTTGAEWKRFYTDPTAWPDGAWHEEEEITIDGEPAHEDADLNDVADSASMTISGGIVFMTNDADEGPTMETHFKRWRKLQNTVFLAIEVPRELADSVALAVAAAGGRVIK